MALRDQCLLPSKVAWAFEALSETIGDVSISPIRNVSLCDSVSDQVLTSQTVVVLAELGAHSLGTLHVLCTRSGLLIPSLERLPGTCFPARSLLEVRTGVLCVGEGFKQRFALKSCLMTL